MEVTRRTVVGGVVTAPALIASGRESRAAPAKILKISHQFPGGTADAGDFRDRLCRKFAAAAEARSNGSLAFEIHANASLMKPVAQFSALRHGTLDMSLYPLAYAGAEVKELNVGLMPCLVTTYEQGFAWRSAEIGKALTATVEAAGVKILTWIWQSGCIACRSGAVVGPEDVKGVKIRGGSREFDLMFKSLGGIVSSVPSNDIYSAMETGSLDAAVTSATSLQSFHLENIAKHMTAGRGRSFWFMFEPLLISKVVFDQLTPAEQTAMSEAGEAMVPFGLASAKADDASIADVFAAKGDKVYEMDGATVDRWRSIASETAWRNFASRSPECARFLSLAQDVKA